jgi:hypothetical protein
MERCPVCRARCKGDPTCHRCGADLGALLDIEVEAAALERRAVRLLESGELVEARRTAERALALQYSPLTCVVRDFARRELIAGEQRRIELLLQ